MVNYEFLMNAYRDQTCQRSHPDLIVPTSFLTGFSDFQENAYKYLCIVIQVSVNCDLSNEYRVKHYLTFLTDVIMKW